MKHSLLITVFILSLIPAFAQSILWDQSFGGSFYDNNPRMVAVHDGYVLCGNTQSDSGQVTNHQGFNDAWLVKTDSSGNLIWQRCIGGMGNDFALQLRATADSGFIVCGHANSPVVGGPVSGGYGLGDAWLIKLDSLGNIEWSKFYGGTQPDYFFDVVQTSDGGYIATGYTMSADHDVTGIHGGSDLWAVKLNAAGQIQWQSSFGGSQYDIGRSVSQTADGGFIIAGNTTSSDGDITQPKGLKDGWILKLGAGGGLQWQKTYGGSQNDDIWKIRPQSDGSFIVIGETRSTDNQVPSGHGLNDVWMFRTDGAGGLQWSRTYGGSQDDGVYDITEAYDGAGYILCGFTHSFDEDVSANHDTITSDAWVVLTNQSGDIEWEHCYGGTHKETAHSILQTGANEFVFSATAGSEDGDVSTAYGYFDFWLVKIAASVIPVSANPLSASAPGIRVYPTLSEGWLQVELPPGEPGGDLTLFNMAGQQVHSTSLAGAQHRLSLPDLASGTYVVQVTTGRSVHRSRILLR